MSRSFLPTSWASVAIIPKSGLSLPHFYEVFSLSLSRRSYPCALSTLAGIPSQSEKISVLFLALGLEAVIFTTPQRAQLLSSNRS